MPMDRSRYHPEWEEISRAIIRLAGDRCELCPAKNGELHWKTKSFVVLTVHHIDGNPKNNRRRNLVALCQRCHLRLDAGLRSSRAAGSGEDLFWKKGRI